MWLHRAAYNFQKFCPGKNKPGLPLNTYYGSHNKELMCVFSKPIQWDFLEGQNGP